MNKKTTMRFVDIFSKMKKDYIIIVSITLGMGCILRIIGCFHGYPFQLHVDEPTIVHHCIDMLKRHSWEANVYNRPDQFEIKCNALLFTLASWIRYHMPAYEAFEQHKHFFFIIARFYTIFFSIVLVPLCIFFIKKIFCNADICNNYTYIVISIILMFSTIFIEHGHFATPDIPLTFFILLFSYYFMLYIETYNIKYIIICSIVTGIGITIKYPMAIMCIPIAFMIIYVQLSNHNNINYKCRMLNIIKYGLISIFIILFTIFIIAPNLFTNIEKTYITIIKEARPHHLGADGLSFSGNFNYYARIAVTNLGYISIVPFFAGIFFLISKINKLTWSLAIIVLFWICISKLHLHWQRWGIPIFLFYNIICSIGIGLTVSTMEKWIYLHIISKLLLLFICLSSIILLLNIIISGICVTKYNLMIDTRVSSLKYCQEHAISKHNSLYEQYTPLAIFSGGGRYGFGDWFLLSKDGNIIINNNYKNKQYYIKSNSFSGRYRREPERYFSQIAIYDAIEKNFKLIYSEIPDGNYSQKPCATLNIIQSIKYLLKTCRYSGGRIYIYDMTQHP